MRILEHNRNSVTLQCEIDEDWKIMGKSINVRFIDGCLSHTRKKLLGDMKIGKFIMLNNKARYYGYIN